MDVPKSGGRFKQWLLCGGILFSAGLTACGPLDESDATSDVTASAELDNSGNLFDLNGAPADWTVFVYGHADHNLSATFIADLAEMSAAKLTPNIQVIVLADLDASQSVNGKKFASGWKLYRIAGSRRDLVEIAQGPEENLDRPEVLSQMTERVFRDFPAERRAVVMWDHGGSWAGGFGGDTDDGTLTGAQIKPMRVLDVTRALGEGLTRAGLSGPRPLDVLAFDTCLMASAEVMTEAESLTSVYIANAELDFGRGWNYSGAFSWLAENPKASAQEFARAEVEIWDEHHRTASLSDSLFRSHGAFDLEQWGGFVSAASEVVAAATSSVDSAGRQGYFTLPTYNSGLEFRAQNPNLRDAGMFAERLAKTDGPLSVAGAKLRQSLASATLGLSLGEYRKELVQMGVHVELTDGKAFDPIKTAYKALTPAWNERASWSNLLQTLSEADDASKPQIVSRVVAPGRMHFRVDSDDVADAKVMIARHTDAGLVPLAPIAHAAIQPHQTYAAEWNGLIYVTGESGAQQELSVLPWMSITADASEQIYFALMQAETGEELAFLFEEGETRSEIAVILGATPAVLTADEIAHMAPGLRVAPIYRTLSGKHSADVLGEFLPLPEGGLSIEAAKPGRDQFAMVTKVSDYWGNVTTIEEEVSCPHF